MTPQLPPAEAVAGRRSGEQAAADPYRAIDAQPDPTEFIERLEARSEARSHARLRRRFLRFARVGRGAAVLEVGSGSGAVARDLARLVGPQGQVVGIDPSRICVVAARRLAHVHGLDGRIVFRIGDGRRLPFRTGRFDVALAITVLLHVDDPDVVVQEMVRVTRPGGVVGLQDQDFGTLALAHPDRGLTARILDGVADRLYPEPFSGRRLPGLLRAAGLQRIRLLTDAYQDTTLEPYTQRFLEHRAETAVKLDVVDRPTAQRWLDGITDTARAGRFVLTLNYFGATGVRP
jgi:ubiquinone/menaquinone biosynthesis C-methylase UbiE